jgi:hypothetical protein
VSLEVNVVLIGSNGDGGYRYLVDGHNLEEFLKTSFPFHWPLCFETGEQTDIEHHIMYKVIAVMLCSGCNNFFLQLCCPIFDPILV